MVTTIDEIMAEIFTNFGFNFGNDYDKDSMSLYKKYHIDTDDFVHHCVNYDDVTDVDNLKSCMEILGDSPKFLKDEVLRQLSNEKLDAHAKNLHKIKGYLLNGVGKLFNNATAPILLEIENRNKVNNDSKAPADVDLSKLTKAELIDYIKNNINK